MPVTASAALQCTDSIFRWKEPLYLVVNITPIVEKVSYKCFIYLDKDWCGKKAWGSRNNLMILFTLLSALFSLKIQFSFKIHSKNFLRDNLLNGVVIKINWVMIYLLKLPLKYNFVRLVTRIGVEIHFTLELLNFWFCLCHFSNCRCIRIMNYKKGEVSLAKSLTFVIKSSERSLM